MTRQEVQTATSLRRSPQEDRRARMIRYSVTMGIRMICLVLVFIFPAVWWVFGIGAVVLPYVAVVFANAGGVGNQDTVRPVTLPQAQIEPPRL